MATRIKKCETCKHWKNHQMLLNYHDETGFCINEELSFNTIDGRRLGVVDTQNIIDRVKVSGNSSHDFEFMKREHPKRIQPSRYLLQTQFDFGCIFHEEKKSI